MSFDTPEDFQEAFKHLIEHNMKEYFKKRIKCPKHPRYLARRRPKADCWDCYFKWWAHSP